MRMNQIVSMAGSLVCRRRVENARADGGIGLRPDFDFTPNEEQPEHGENGIHAHKTDEREPGVSGPDTWRNAMSRAHQAVDKPGLASQLRGHPAGGVCNIWQGHAE